MKSMKKLLAIVLSLSLVFTMAVPSFAAVRSDAPAVSPLITKTFGNSGKELNYLVLGDSMTNGYGTPGYVYDANEGFNRAPDHIYSALFAKYLNEKFGYKVNLYQYAFSGVRAEDVANLLFNDNEKNKSNYVREDAYQRNFFAADRVANFQEFTGTPEEKISQLKANYRAAVEKADLISISLGMNNFTLMFEEIISRNLGLDFTDSLEPDPKTGQVYGFENLLTGQKYKIYKAAKEKIIALLGDKAMNDNQVVALVYDLMYSLASFLNSYEKLASRIYELNPDATVAFIGFPNGVRDVTAVYNYNGINIPIDLETMIGILFTARNAYIQLIAQTYGGDSFYVDYNDCGQVSDELANNLDENVATTEAEDRFGSYQENIVLDTLIASPFNSICQALVDKLKVEENVIIIIDGDEPEPPADPYEFNQENIIKGVKYIQAADKDAVADYADCALVGQVYLGMRAHLINVLKNSKTYGKFSLNSLIDFIPALSDADALTDAVDAMVDSADADAVEAAKGTMGDDKALSALIQKMIDSNAGANALIYFYGKLVLGNGFAIHTSTEGYAQEAAKIEKAYEKFLLKQKVRNAVATVKKINNTMKAAVAITVGGTAVAFVTREVGGQIISAVIAAKIIKKAKEIFGENTDSTLLRTLRLVTIL